MHQFSSRTDDQVSIMRYLSSDLTPRRNSVGEADAAGCQEPLRLQHPHLPPLFYASNNQRWAEVKRRSKSHPREIYVAEEISGNTPLHVACRHDPPIEVVKCLLRCANVKNTEGATPLHVSASHRCSAEVIRVLIEDGPIACKKDKKNGDTNNHPTSALTRIGRAPIHYACMSFRGLSIGAFKVLLEATINAPTSCEFTKYADLLDSDEVSVLSKEDQEECEESANRGNTMTLRDGTGQTPLGLLFLRYRERVRCVINKMVDTSEISNTVLGIHAISAATHAVQADLGELWKKSRIIVSMMAEHQLKDDDISTDVSTEYDSPAESAAAMEAAAWASSKHQGKLPPEEHPKIGGKAFRIVHASVGLTGYGCPPEMIRLAISVHPNQVREMDEEGRLPIHIAAVASSAVSDTSKKGAVSDDDSMITSSTFMSSFGENAEVKNPFDQVIRILLRNYPASAQIPHGKNGRLPLTLATDAERRTWHDGIKALVQAFPPALESREIDPKLYPSILALIGKKEVGESTVRTKSIRAKAVANKQSKVMNSVFEIVKAKPSLLDFL